MSPRTKSKGNRARQADVRSSLLRTAIAVVTAMVLFTVPLAMSTRMLNVYTTPKYLVLVLGASILAPLITASALDRTDGRVLRSSFPVLLAGFLAAFALSTAVSADPELAFTGTFTSRMGWVTRAAMIVCSMGVLVAVDGDRAAFGRLVFWQTAVGGIVAFICVLQIVGATSMYPSDFLLGETVPRVHGSVGHPDFAGNYLLTIVFPAMAIAVAATGVARGIGTLIAAMAALAILFTGTRGAWVGLLAGLAIVATLLWRSGLLAGLTRRQWRFIAAGVSLFVVGSALAIALHPSADPIRQRLAAFSSEGFTGAGRTGVWRFTVSLVPKFWTFGCGSDLFKLAQTPYKSLAYVQATNGVNVEDPHSTYLSALVSGGVLVFVAYLASIAVAVRKLPKSIAAAATREDAAIGIGLAGAVGAVLVHDLFLHHTIVNGLAFYVLLAFAYAWGRMPNRDASASGAPPAVRAHMPGPVRWLLAGSVTLVIPVVAIHAYRVAGADVAIFRSLRASFAGDSETVIEAGERAASFGLPQPDPRFYYAVALERLARNSSGLSEGSRYFAAAADQASLAVERPLVPVPYVAYAASLSLSAGRPDQARGFLERAQRMDPFSYHAELSALQFALAEQRIDDAIRHFDRVKIMNSPYVDVSKARDLLRQAIRTQTGSRTDVQREFLRREFNAPGNR